MDRQKNGIALKTLLILLFAGVLALSILVVSLRSFQLYKQEMVTLFATSRMDTLLQISRNIAKDQQEIIAISDVYLQDKELVSLIAADGSQCMGQEEFTRYITNKKQEIDAMLYFLETPYELQIVSDNGLAFSQDPVQLQSLAQMTRTPWYYRALKDATDSYWLSNNSIKTGDTRKNMVSFVRFIKQDSGKTVGAILINLDERYLNKRYSEIVTEKSNIYLVDWEGRIVTHSIESVVGRLFYNMNMFNNFFKDRPYAVIDKAGEAFLFSRYISEENPWIVVEEISMSSITSPLETVSRSLWSIAIAVMAAGFALSSSIAHWVSRPLKHIATSMHLAGQGNLKVSFSETGCTEARNIARDCRKFVREIEDLMEGIKSTEADKRTSELGFLQMQLNPHFIYNTLFTIRCMIDMGLDSQASATLDSFTNMLKKVFKITAPMIPIADNLAYLDDYLFIMKQRFGESLSIAYDVQQGVENLRILKFLLQPIIENSIYHGFPQASMQHPNILVSIHATNELINICIQDNGCGMSPDTLQRIFNPIVDDKPEHIGLGNVKKQLELYYGQDASMTIESSPGQGTAVTIIVPVSSADPEEPS